MKKLILFILLIVNSFSLFAQDIGISGSFLPHDISVGSTTTCTVSFSNNDLLEIPVGGAWIQVNFPPQYDANKPPTGTLLTYFKNFSYDTTNGVWFGRNSKAIPTGNQGFAGASFVFIITGKDVIGTNDATLFDTDFEIWTDRNPSDNQSTAGLIVTKAPPTEILSFASVSIECGKIELTWTTGKERNNDYMEILRSTNGKDFIAIGKVKGANHYDGTTYSLTDEIDLTDGTQYYYMIRQVDFDATVNNHPAIIVKYICKVSEPKMSVFPNPASVKVNILISSNEDKDIDVNVINKEGIIVRKITIKPDLPYELEVKDLPSGEYQIQSLDLEKTLIQSFIHVK